MEIPRDTTARPTSTARNECGDRGRVRPSPPQRAISNLFTTNDYISKTYRRIALDEIAEQALARGTGARGLRAILEEVLLNIMYDVPSRTDVAKVVINGEAPSLDGVAGVTAVEAIAGVVGGLRITVVGSPSSLIARLAHVAVVRLRTVEPSLEDIFLTYY